MPISHSVAEFINNFVNDIIFCKELADSIDGKTEVKAEPKLEEISILQDELSNLTDQTDESEALYKSLFHYSDGGSATSSHNFAMDVVKNEKFFNLGLSDMVSVLPSKAKSFLEISRKPESTTLEKKTALLSLFQNYVLERYIPEKAIEVFVAIEDSEKNDILNNIKKLLAGNCEKVIFTKLREALNNAKSFHNILEIKRMLTDIVKTQPEAKSEQGESIFTSFHDIVIDEKPTTIEIVSSFKLYISKDGKEIKQRDEINELHQQVEEKWKSLPKEKQPLSRKSPVVRRRRPKEEASAAPETSTSAKCAQKTEEKNLETFL